MAWHDFVIFIYAHAGGDDWRTGAGERIRTAVTFTNDRGFARRTAQFRQDTAELEALVFVLELQAGHLAGGERHELAVLDGRVEIAESSGRVAADHVHVQCLLHVRIIHESALEPHTVAETAVHAQVPRLFQEIFFDAHGFSGIRDGIALLVLDVTRGLALGFIFVAYGERRASGYFERT